MSDTPILQVSDLARHYPLRRGLAGALRGEPAPLVRAVDGVSFSLGRGEVLALVGESGCGKTTTALMALGLVEPSAGEVRFEGRPLHAGLRRDRGLRQALQMVFQDPYESLNPRMRVAEIVAEPLEVHRLGAGRAGRRERVRSALEEVGLRPAEEFLGRLPHELSGGQRQRVAIATALVTGPRLLIADEPVSMLDVSIRAEILGLLNQLRRLRGISTLFITHDLATAALFADRVAVMYLGRIVEIGPTATVLGAPRHPYTRALLSVVPSIARRGRERIILQGETPNPAAIPAGCRFHPRCPLADAGCRAVDPPLAPSGEPLVACVKA